MNKKEFQDMVASMYMHYTGDMRFYYGGTYHSRDEAKRDLVKHDPELARKLENIETAQAEFAAHVRHRLG